jgi:uncharacterized protein
VSEGTISYIEIGSGPDPAASQIFFGALFGWTYQPMSAAGNGWFQTPTIRAGLHPDDPEPGIFPFFEVADLAAAVARVRALGGQASAPGPVEPGFGQFSLCADPQGVKFGLHRKSDD